MSIPLEKLRRAARSLLKSARTGDTAALARILRHCPHANPPKLADALHATARENGAASWPLLKLTLETAETDRSERAERLSAALFHGRTQTARHLLALDPRLPHQSLGLAVALLDLPRTRAALARDPAAATRIIGNRRPILHLSFSRYIHTAPEKRADMLEIAAMLVRHGADVNDSFSTAQDEDAPLSALYGALGHADNLALAEWLLDHGATPDDGESLYHATELGHLDGLRLLLRHGATIDGTNALARMLDFNNTEGVRLLLDHGADPGGDTLPALHQAARRMCSGEIARLLIGHGADGCVLWNGQSAYALARICGNSAVAEVLESAGQSTPLTPDEALLAAAANGPVTGRLDPDSLPQECRLLLTRLIPCGADLAHLQRLAGLGIDPDWTDESGLTAIQAAGWEGRADIVAWLLSLNPDLEHRNRFGGTLLETIVHGAAYCPSRASRDHIACARLTLEAGAVLPPALARNTGVEEMAAFLEDWPLRIQERP